MKKQIIVIHGGTAFDTYKDYLLFLKKLKVDLDRYRKEKIEKIGKTGWRDISVSQ